MAHISRSEKIDLIIITTVALILVPAAFTGIAVWVFWLIQALQ